MKEQIIAAYVEQLNLIEKLFSTQDFENYCQEELAHLLKVNELKRRLIAKSA